MSRMITEAVLNKISKLMNSVIREEEFTCKNDILT